MGNKVELEITTNTDVQVEADHHSTFHLSVICVKGVIVLVITQLTGEQTTDLILQTANGTDFNPIDE